MEFTASYFLGGLACIDFCNTFDHLHTPPAYDFFQDPRNIADWAKAAGILPAKPLRAAAPSKHAAVRLIALRTRIFRILWPLSQGKTPAQTDLDAFNEDWRKAAARRRIVGSGTDFSLQEELTDPIDRIAGSVISTAAELLLSGRADQVRRCEGCNWLFLDTSRNGMRRWCTMKICGNRAKARRHYEQVRR